MRKKLIALGICFMVMIGHNTVQGTKQKSKIHPALFKAVAEASHKEWPEEYPVRSKKSEIAHSCDRCTFTTHYIYSLQRHTKRQHQVEH
jgi:hypothetical protein